jgi:hypothetical protein
VALAMMVLGTRSDSVCTGRSVSPSPVYDVAYLGGHDTIGQCTRDNSPWCQDRQGGASQVTSLVVGKVGGCVKCP